LVISQLNFGILVGGTLSIDPDKLETLQNWILPTTGKQCGSFIGLVQYFRSFIGEQEELQEAIAAFLKDFG
jgi:hypothetical protein